MCQADTASKAGALSNGKQATNIGQADVASKSKALSKQYGGVHAGTWVDSLPSSWIPYTQICRLSPPAGLFLVFFPHLFGALHVATVGGQLPEPLDVARNVLVLFGLSFFYSNAIHAWNDLIDADIDAKIERTRTRPIPRGAISRRAALIFTITQVLAVAPFLYFLPKGSTTAFLLNLPASAYYPFAKRHTYFPQLVVGDFLAWGVFTGGVGLSLTELPEPSACALFIGSAAWFALNDFIYAHQDVEEDAKLGVKSMALRFRNSPTRVLWTLFFIIEACLILSGYLAGMGIPFFTIAVGGTLVSVGSMVTMVGLQDSESCWKWFSQGFYPTGFAIAGGLLGEYAFSLYGWK